mmetsp:Transcript_20177/g.56072  ORF Transcript_20177/g.56072 Transcript_20177/m.56072 type:complete len:371 (+) Transcript_20177:303-1415(+)
MMCKYTDRENRKEIQIDRSSQYLPMVGVPNHRADSSTSSSSDDEKKASRSQLVNDTKLSIIRLDELQPYDILCGRDKATFNNIGNRRFRVSIGINIPKYEKAKSKAEKAEVIQFVCNVLRNDVGARFLRRCDADTASKDEDFYYVELDEREARKKVGHALRDMSVARQQVNAKRLSAERRRHKDNSIDTSNKTKKSAIADDHDRADSNRTGGIFPGPIFEDFEPEPIEFPEQPPPQVLSRQLADAYAQLDQQKKEFQQRQNRFRELQNQQMQQQQHPHQHEQQLHPSNAFNMGQHDSQDYDSCQVLLLLQRQQREEQQRQQHDGRNPLYNQNIFHPAIHQEQHQQQQPRQHQQQYHQQQNQQHQQPPNEN